MLIIFIYTLEYPATPRNELHHGEGQRKAGSDRLDLIIVEQFKEAVDMWADRRSWWKAWFSTSINMRFLDRDLPYPPLRYHLYLRINI